MWANFILKHKNDDLHHIIYQIKKKVCFNYHLSDTSDRSHAHSNKYSTYISPGFKAIIQK